MFWAYTDDRVLNEESFTHKFQELILLYLFTELSTGISNKF